MARTLKTVLDRAENYLYGPYQREFALLGANLDDTQPDVTITDTAPTVAGGSTIRRGTVLNVGTETMVVVSWDSTAGVAQTLRGHLGTEPTAHLNDDLVDINPRFPRGVAWLDLLDELLGLPESIYRVVNTEYTLTEGERVVPLTDAEDAYGVAGVQASSHLDGEWMRFGELGYIFRRTTDGPVVVLDEVPTTTGSTVEIRIKRPVDPSVAALTSTLEDLGLLDSMADVVAMGIAIRRIAFAEIQRSNRQAQGEPRLAEESPPLHQLQTASGLRQIYDRRIGQEAAKLWAMHGVRWS